jgi:starch-binding outer membrane protein, SusD/RagB family
MRRYHIIAARVRAAVAVSAVALIPMLGACGDVKDTLLEAVDPDIIPPAAANSPEGALALYNGALTRLKTITSGTGGEGSTWLFGGLLADEWSTSSTFVQNDETDQRSIQLNNSTVTTMFRQLARARTSTRDAFYYMRIWRETETTRIAELYFVRAFAEMQMANDFCNGIPLSSQDSSGALIFDTPRTNAYVFEAAVASADSGLALIPATATGTQDLLVRRALLVTKARALLGLDKIAEAAALVPASAVPTTYTYDLTYATSSGDITLWAQPRSSRRYTVGDSLEGRGRNLLVKNALPFFSGRLLKTDGTRVQDPRVPATYTVSGKDTTISQDGLIPSRTTTLWGRSTTVSAVNGLDARLIEAEALLRANDYVGMTAILQALRNSPPKLGEITPSFTGVTPLVAPTTRDAAINLYFREKAFWQFGRGYRLGDLRRLIRQYGRTQDQVFPVGVHYRGGNYGTDVNLPVPQAEENNPVLESRPACIDRKA